MIRNGRNIYVNFNARCMEYFCSRILEDAYLLQQLLLYIHTQKCWIFMAIITWMQNKSTLHYQFHENQLNCLRLHLRLRFTNSHVNNNNRISIIFSQEIGFREVGSKKKTFICMIIINLRRLLGNQIHIKHIFLPLFFY